MEKFNLLIVLIQAYLNACKDFHYFCNNFSLHLLADEIMAGDDLYEVLDGIKENVFIAHGLKPLVAKKYAVLSANATPMIRNTDRGNLLQLYGLAGRISNVANSIKSERRCENALLDTIADKMAHAMTLLEIEMRKGDIKESLTEIQEEAKFWDSVIEEAEEAIRIEHDHKAATETPVDRKEVKMAKIDYDKVAKTVKDYESQNLLVAEAEEENTLDKLAEKLGVQ